MNEISSYGVPLGSIVVAKPITAADASSGYVAAAALQSALTAAVEALGWPVGVAAHQWSTAAAPSWAQVGLCEVHAVLFVFVVICFTAHAGNPAKATALLYVKDISELQFAS